MYKEIHEALSLFGEVLELMPSIGAGNWLIDPILLKISNLKILVFTSFCKSMLQLIYRQVVTSKAHVLNTSKYMSHLNLYASFLFTGQPPVVLSPGIHSFPFKLGLPLGLPSTFLSKLGWVQYYCKTALREPNGLTHKNQQVFIVMNPIDLNQEPSVLAVSILVSIIRKRKS